MSNNFCKQTLAQTNIEQILLKVPGQSDICCNATSQKHFNPVTLYTDGGQRSETPLDFGSKGHGQSEIVCHTLL